MTGGSTMVEIRIDNTGDGTFWLYGSTDAWKDYCGCDNFDEEVVIFGNRNLCGVTNASWYQEAREILDDIDSYDIYPGDLYIGANDLLKKLYDDCTNTDDIILDVLRVLHPNEKFTMTQISGYCQGDWQNIITKGDVNIDLIESFYFGKIAEVFVQDDGDSFCDVITHDELWEAERGDLKEYMRKRYEIPQHKEVKVFEADGKIQVPNWKEVC